uniref:Uncharacterized protein n=1 Tax=viral metagenome TaxID=1070528 RepID=A0A6H1ZQ32_9ZZZZ
MEKWEFSIQSIAKCINLLNNKMTSTHGEKELKNKWPVTTGTTFGTTKQVGKRRLSAERDSYLQQRDFHGS